MKATLSILLLLVLLTGCAQLDKALTHEQVTVNPTSGLVVTNIVPNPSAQVATELVNLSPFPYAGLVSTILAGGLGLYAQIRNRKHQRLLSNREQVLEAVVSGVELAGVAAAEVKNSIRKAAQARGIEQDLHETVKGLGG